MPRAPSRRFAALSSWNFRAYFVGQLISTVGTWMQTLALAWLVLELTDRGDQLGYTIALQWLPLLVLGPYTGVIADRIDNRRLLVATSIAAGSLAVVLGVASWAGVIGVGWVYAIAPLLGLVNAFERPAMQAILFQLVGPDRLPSAIGINGTINTTGRMIGPALAGVVIATAGITACFFLNAVSYVIVVAMLLALRRREMVPRPRLEHTRGQLRAGLTYVWRNPDVRRPLLVMAFIGTIAYNFQITIPAMVRFGFDRGPGAVGAVLSISAIGSVAGGLFAAGLRPHPRRTLAAACVALGIGLIGFATAPTYGWYVASSIPLAITSSAFLTIDATVLQQATDPAMQGRVMSLHQIAWQGTTPLGSLLVGWLIQGVSPRAPFAVGSAAALLTALAVAGAGVTRARNQPRTVSPAAG